MSQYMLTTGEQEAATCRRLASVYLNLARGFLGGSDGKESAPSAGDLGSIPGLGRSPGKRYKHLNAEFQRIARRGKKAFLSDQWSITQPLKRIR